MASKTNTISHMMYATEWDHVNVSYISRTEVDNEVYEKPSDKQLTSKAVLDAARALEKAVIRELGKADEKAEVRTMRQNRDERAKAFEEAGMSPEEARMAAVMPRG